MKATILALAMALGAVTASAQYTSTNLPGVTLDVSQVSQSPHVMKCVVSQPPVYPLSRIEWLSTLEIADQPTGPWRSPGNTVASSDMFTTVYYFTNRPQLYFRAISSRVIQF